MAAPITAAATRARTREGCSPWTRSAIAGAAARTAVEAAISYFARAIARSSCVLVIFERPSIFRRFAWA